MKKIKKTLIFSTLLFSFIANTSFAQNSQTKAQPMNNGSFAKLVQTLDGVKKQTEPEFCKTSESRTNQTCLKYYDWLKAITKKLQNTSEHEWPQIAAKAIYDFKKVNSKQ